MCSLCRLPVAKNHNFVHILNFGGSCTGSFLPIRLKFGVLKYTGRLHLCAKFHLTFGGLLYRPPITDESQIWCATADPQQTFTCQNLSGSVYSIALWRRKAPIFAVFSTSAFSVVDSWRQSQKVEYGCTTTNLPLSNGIKIISVLQRLHG